MTPQDASSTAGRTDPRAGDRPPAPDPLPLPVVDNHTHLDIARDGVSIDVAQAVSAAKRVGVTRIVQIGCDLPGARFTAQVVAEHPAILGGVALHPNEIPRLAAAGELSGAYAEIERLVTDHERIRVVGETGLDYYRTGPDGHQVQQDAFRWHIDLAKRTCRVLQIHDRDAHDDVLAILAQEGAPERTVLHCFSGDVAMAQACVERGYYLSFAGTVSFKSARGLRDALSIVPLERLLVETDAPYLTPSPHRGATNAPYLMPLTVRAIAAVKGVAVADLCAAVSRTSEELYGPWA